MIPTIHPMYSSLDPIFYGIELGFCEEVYAAMMWEPNAELVHTRIKHHGYQYDLWAREFSTDETIPLDVWLGNFAAVSGSVVGVPVGPLIGAGRFYLVTCSMENYLEANEWARANYDGEKSVWWARNFFFTHEEDAIMFKLRFK